MADLEEHAIRRDRRFLVRLALLILVGGIASAWVLAKLTSREVGSCAATFFGAQDPKSAKP